MPVATYETLAAPVPVTYQALQLLPAWLVCGKAEVWKSASYCIETSVCAAESVGQVHDPS